MAFPVLDTPRTDFGASTTQARDLADFSQDSIPSPSKDNNDLLKQIKGLRGAQTRAPRLRTPLGDRRNVPSKHEFTPLLKSATRNRSALNGFGKENKPKTPAGFKDSFRSDGPDLPVNSSVILEEETGSSAGDQGTPIAPVSSSSALTTPMPAFSRRNQNGGDGGNLATLREQEERLEAIDKENFSLKLKIHFLEEALRKSGKDFNEAALRENTELKVDKVTLQRDLKHQRRSLGQAEKDLQDYKQQLMEYADKLKLRHDGGEAQQDVQALRQALADNKAEMEEMRQSASSNAEKDAQIADLQDEVGDLQQDIRAKEMEADEKQEEIDRLKEESASTASSEELDSLRAQLQEKEDDMKGYDDALRQANIETEQKLSSKDRQLEAKDDELRELEDELEKACHQSSIDAKDSELQSHRSEIDSLRRKLADNAEKAKNDLDALHDQLASVETETATNLRQKARIIEEKNAEIHTLEQKLQSAEGRDGEAEELHDQIEALTTELREKQGNIDKKQDLIDELQTKIRQVEAESDEELMTAQDRIHELETDHQRHLKELQALRDAGSKADTRPLESAKMRMKELEEQLQRSRDIEKQLHIDIHQHQDQIKRLEGDLDDQHGDSVAERQRWDRQRCNLEAAKADIEEQAKSLERTIQELQRTEGSLSGREMALQQALHSEKQRHDSSRAALQKQLDEANDECALLQESQQKAEAAERKLLDELSAVNDERKKTLEAAQHTGAKEGDFKRLQADLRSSQEEKRELHEKIQGLEDEVEVLQTSLDENEEKAKDDSEAAKSEADGLRRQLRGLQQDLARAQLDHANIRAELENLQSSQATSSPQGLPRSRVQQKLQDSHTQVAQLSREIRSLEAEHTASKADLEALQATSEDVHAARVAAQDAARDLRKQLKDLQREADRKLQTQINAYETDIGNLEQDLEASQSKSRELTAKNESLASSVTRLKTKLATAETELATANATRGSPASNTSVAERKDLHEMLRDAKLKAEDFALRLNEREKRAESAAIREADLRSQLQRVREERKAAAQRADAAIDGHLALKDQYEVLVEERDELCRLQKGVRFPKGSTCSSAPAPDGQESPDLSTALTKAKHRHTLELQGLVRQIEYLSARLRREEAFRQDLSYGKRYANKVLELYAKVHKLDLGLVRDMGVPVDDVCAQQKRECNAGRVRRTYVAAIDARIANAGAVMPGVDATPRGKNGGTPRQATSDKPQKDTRPTLRSVAFMVLAGVRMRKGAESWRGVRKNHEGLVKKLAAVRKDRERRERTASKTVR